MKVWKKTAVLMVIVLFVIAFRDTGDAGQPGVLVVSASSTTQQQIDEEERRRQELEQEKNENESELNDLRGEQDGLKKELNNLSSELNKVVANLENLELQIQEKEQQITETQEALDAAREKEEWQYDCMVLRVRDMYERKEESYLVALLRESSLADILNAADYIERVAAYERK